MRIISASELPPEYGNHVLIKASERNRYRRLGNALEKTLQQCSQIRAENEIYLDALKEDYMKAGFVAGYRRFMSQLTRLLEQYQVNYAEREKVFRTSLISAIQNALADPVIVGKLIEYMNEQSEQQQAPVVILPKGTPIPEGKSETTYLFSESSDIIVKNNTGAIKFPGDALCQQWLSTASQHCASLDAKLTETLCCFYTETGKELLAMASTLSESAPYENNEDVLCN